ncbi:MAG: starch-binding protein [Bacteroidales bacterium]|nr:starch-binding protein [Bacteroidales bacterium]
MKRFATSLLTALAATVAVSAQAPVESRAFYSTNANDAVGAAASITIDGSFSDWNDNLIVATCGANDMCNAFHGSHENSLIDIYAIYAAWDDSNLYVAWQMCNTGDTWARPGDGPLTDGGRIGDVPFIVAISVDPTSVGMTGMLKDGRFIWGDNAENGVKFNEHADHLFFMSGKPGLGAPAMFTAADATGVTDYGSHCHLFTNSGIKYAMAEGFAPSHLWRQRTFAEWSDATTLVSDPSIINNIYDSANYDNLLEGTPEGLQPHDTSFDSFYEMQIPFTALGINRQWLEANGIGLRVVGTRGESGIDCCPFDASMVDNVFEIYAKDNSTSHEKDDIDIITYAMASVGAIRTGSTTPLPDPDPEPDPTDGNYTIYFDNSSSNWANVYTWVWDKAENDRNYSGGSWPGTALSLDSVTGFYKYSFTCDNTNADLWCIFSNQGASKTEDLALVNYGIYNASGFTGQCVDGIDDIYASPADAQAVYYNLQGTAIEQPAPGNVYIKVVNGSATKVVIRQSTLNNR